MATNANKAINGGASPQNHQPTLTGGYAGEDGQMIDMASDNWGLQLADAIRAASWNKAIANLNSGYCGPQTQKAIENFAAQWNSVDYDNIATGKTAKTLKPSSSKSYFALPAALENGGE
ncbi:MAG: hypothetical protein J7545_15630 [Roseofilum sp. SBFL]|uniref:hypothetical protein n=1 Tax=Roseofilum sp. SBFL TaxID=2821496 RepID=UPI001B162B97|nr:hypothetical protein [Roseofilum sp. SBFL]MBP0043378.1 hypothetical protein [Roseofilum sp. SBFL]